MIRFESFRQVAEFHSPLEGGALVRQEIEFRKDPLLGHVSVFNEAIRGKKNLLFPDTDFQYIAERAESTRGTCFLCNKRWEDVTPRYSERLLPGGRLIKNDCVLFPNLFPVAPYHAVVMVGSEHYRSLEEFPQELLHDAIEISISFAIATWKNSKDCPFFTINANYLPPAGASLIHPHLQVVGSGIPSSHHEHLINATRAFYNTNGVSFWHAIVEEEKKQRDRYVMCGADTAHVMTAYSPMGTNEVQIVWPNRKTFLEWTEDDIRGFAIVLSYVLKAYHVIGFSTFNFACYSGSFDGPTEADGCLARIITRQNMVPHHRTDDYYLQKLLGNEIAFYSPEELAGIIRDVISSHGNR